MPRGGRRSGAPGKAYANRSDLNGPQPVTRIPNQPYGVQAQQVRAQQSVPVGATPAPTTQGPLPPQGVVGTPPTGTTPIPLNAPTMRPHEPVTAGIDALPSNLGAPPVLIAAVAALGTIPEHERDDDTVRLLNLLQAQIGNQAAV